MKQMDALQKLEQYVNMPSGSADLEGLTAFVPVVEKDMQALGFTVTRHPMAGRGDALECVYGDGEDTLLLIGHMDTVFAREENQPFAVDGDRLTGSGVMDMKGGVLIMRRRWPRCCRRCQSVCAWLRFSARTRKSAPRVAAGSSRNGPNRPLPA